MNNKNYWVLLILIILSTSVFGQNKSLLSPNLKPAGLIDSDPLEPLNILIYHETAGYRHTDAITSGISMIKNFNGWTAYDSQTSDAFNSTNLDSTDVVVWLNTSGDGLLTAAEQLVFRTFIQNGGGFVGVHAATDTYRDSSWVWYSDLVGGMVQKTPTHTSSNHNNTMDVVGSHPAINHLGTEWNKIEEYYYWKLNGGYLYSGNIDLLRVRATGSSNSYEDARPITWYKEYDGGRSFYTALGHNDSDYSSNANFIVMIKEAISWAGGLSEVITDASGGLSGDDGFICYPNPTDNLLMVELDASQNGEIRIIDFNGKTLKSESFFGKSIQVDMGLMKEGAYILEVVSEGNSIMQKKIYKK